MVSATVGSEWTAHNLGAGNDRVKQCSKCLQFKPATFEYFYKRPKTKDGLMHQCKACKDEKNKLNKFKKLGLTEDEYEQWYIEQGKTCAICHGTWNQTLHIDHDHKTGQIRGLLCSECNNGIGKLKDNPNLLRKAIAYLEIGMEE